ncbi:FHA domain-containing protein [Nocardioides sp. W3-2-3]|uniref:FHA domain-containing protein n=1 Tax=Nocardioides convexus TaxID=2712224 RepID=UPI00241859EA|nr:FHA domain-containing protein [Nocardioides convexus]NHA00425.1 FHA domain-containing protein [Nocardioides convexus]
MDRLQVQWSGTTRIFDGPRVVVGRESDCDVPVSDGRASRHHLTLLREGSAWVAVDSSSNGTYVAGQRITRTPLPAGPLNLHLGGPDGETVVVTVLASQPAPPAPADSGCPAAAGGPGLLPSGAGPGAADPAAAAARR